MRYISLVKFNLFMNTMIKIIKKKSVILYKINQLVVIKI